MISSPPAAGFYMGKGGGILNAILGSFYLAIGGTVLASLIAAPAILYLHVYAAPNARLANLIRLALDVLWGIPSIVYGAFGFAVMMAIGLRASLLAGMLTLALVVMPILARTYDEVVSLAPRELREITFAMGTTRFEYLRVLLRQTLPGLVTALLLAFGRGIGDAAAVLFTAGFTDAMPDSLLRPVASLPLGDLLPAQHALSGRAGARLCRCVGLDRDHSGRQRPGPVVAAPPWPQRHSLSGSS